MLKRDYTDKDQLQDIRILAGWGALKDLTAEEQQRVTLARTRLSMLTAAEAMPVISRLNQSSIPFAAPPPHRDPHQRGKPLAHRR